MENTQTKPGSNKKFVIGIFFIIAAVVYLIATSTAKSSQYFLTVDELVNSSSEIQDRDLRVSGAVIGDSIEYEQQTLTLRFTVAHLPGNNKEIEEAGGLAVVLHDAVSDPEGARLQVVYNGVMPDLLQHEAQAIMTGRIDADGVFYADELLLKCPTKYEEAIPDQIDS